MKRNPITLEGRATSSPSCRIVLETLAASYHSALEIVHARRTAAIALVLLATMILSPTTPAGETDPEDAKVASLPVVLDVRRDAELDRWVTTDGQTHAGRVLNESFRLRTSHGELQLPARFLAAIDLTRQRDGIDSIVTVAADRLSGFLLEPQFRFQTPPDTNAVSELRRERIAKILFRLSPADSLERPPESLIILRNGDFLGGRIQPDKLRIRQSGAEPGEFLLAGLAALDFSEWPVGLVRVEPVHGDAWEGTMSPLDVQIELAIGLPLTIYSDRIASIRRWTGLSFELAGRIGIPSTPAHRPAGPTNVISPGLVWIPPGEFFLGSPNEEKDRELDEGPSTRAIIPDGFWIAAHEVTQADYESLIGRNPSQYTGDGRRPVEKVNWQEATDFCRALNAREQAAGRLPDGYAFRLPTELEWEYACRAGTSTRFSHGDDPGYLETPGYAWCGHNSGSSTHPVGTLKPNPWGLFDMHGNVWEWCLDAWSGVYPGGTITNAVSAPQGSLRVARGGSWLYDPRFCRSANRDSYGMLNRCSDVGFRVVLAPIP
jgi:formylglycine-generating enzyme required for sulfatase activity